MPARFHVFLSHNSADKPEVEELAHRLQKEGIEPWLDKWHLIPGEPWQSAMEDALKHYETCAVFIGPSGLGSWQNEEMRAAINQRVRDSQGKFRVIPVVLPGGQRGERTGLPSFLEATTWVEFTRSLDDKQAFYRLICAIRGIKPGPGPSPGQATYVGQCPYRGLEAFHAEHQKFFFGRQALTEWLLNALRRPPGTRAENRFLAIVGSSGSGKSSLALAGLVPAVQRGELEGSADWLLAICRPEVDPLESLAVALGKAGVIESSSMAVSQLHDQLRNEERTLHRTVRLALHEAPPSRRLLLLLDQFEEVFTLCPDEGLRHALITNLLYAASVVGGQTLVVLTLRADFYGKSAANPALAAALSEHQVLVGPLTDEELRQAIEEPAQLTGCSFQPGLVDVLIDDVRHQAGALPLLQYALRELWKRRQGERLTEADYQAIGRLKGALDRRANEVLQRFTATEKELCRRIFLRLTQPGEGTEDTKRRISLRELETAGGDAQVVERVVQKLADERLITTEDEEQVEVAHEALIRSWSALRQWIEVDRAGLRTHRRLGEAAREWLASGREESFLYEGARLAVAQEWAAAHTADLNQGEREFLTASARRVERKRKWKRQLRIAALGLSLLVLVLGVGGAIVLQLWREAETARDRAEEARKEAVRTRDLLEVEKNRTDKALEGEQQAKQREQEARKRESEAREKFLQAGYVHQVELAHRDWAARRYSRADQLLAGCELQRRGWEWYYVNRLCHRDLLTLKGHTGQVNSVAFSSDGKRLASASEDGTVKVWDAQTGQEALTLKGHAAKVKSVAFSPDGARLASASSDKTVKIWDAQTGQEALTLEGRTDEGPPGAVYSVAFSPDGAHLASSSGNGRVSVWDWRGPRQIRTFDDQYSGKVMCVAFSSDGKRLASASEYGTVWVSNAETGKDALTLKVHIESVNSVAFSPDGGRLASASKDGTVKIWNSTVSEGNITRWNDKSVRSIAFSPDSMRLASACDDETVKVWDLRPSQEHLILKGHSGRVQCVAFSPDGKHLATASSDGTVKTWDAQTGQDTFTFNGQNGVILSVAFSPDSTRLASAAWDETVKVWDAQTGQEALTFKGGHDLVYSVAFSPDGKRLAGASSDRTVKVWDLSAGQQALTLEGHTDRVLSVAFSPDGRLLASASADQTVKVWDAQTGQQILNLNGHSNAVNGVCFDSDGKRLASAGWDGTVILWDAQTGAETFTLEHSYGSRVTSVAFSPDGKRLASGSWDRTVNVWDATPLP